MNLAQVRKFAVALFGAVASAASLGLLPDVVAKWVTVAVVFCSALGVYIVPNGKMKEVPDA